MDLLFVAALVVGIATGFFVATQSVSLEIMRKKEGKLWPPDIGFYMTFVFVVGAMLFFIFASFFDPLSSQHARTSLDVVAERKFVTIFAGWFIGSAFSYIFFFPRPIVSPWSNPQFIVALAAVILVTGIFVSDRLSAPASIQVGSSGFNVQFAVRPAETGARQPLGAPGHAFSPPLPSGSATRESQRLRELSFLGATAAWMPEHGIPEDASMRWRDRFQILLTDNVSFESLMGDSRTLPYPDRVWLRLIGPVYTCIYNLLNQQNSTHFLGLPQQYMREFSVLAYIVFVEELNLLNRVSQHQVGTEFRPSNYQSDRLVVLRDHFLEAARSYYRGRLDEHQRIVDRSCNAASFQEADALLFSQGRTLGLPTLPYVPIALAILMYMSGEREGAYALPNLWLRSAPARPPGNNAQRMGDVSRLPRLFELRAHTAEALLRLYDDAGWRSEEALLALERADRAFSRVVQSSALQDGSRMRTPRDLASSGAVLRCEFSEIVPVAPRARQEAQEAVAQEAERRQTRVIDFENLHRNLIHSHLTVIRNKLFIFSWLLHEYSHVAERFNPVSILRDADSLLHFQTSCAFPRNHPHGVDVDDLEEVSNVNRIIFAMTNLSILSHRSSVMVVRDSDRRTRHELAMRHLSEGVHGLEQRLVRLREQRARQTEAVGIRTWFETYLQAARRMLAAASQAGAQ